MQPRGEGIETEAELVTLVYLDVRSGQGYDFLARKVPGGLLLEVYDKATGLVANSSPAEFMTEVDCATPLGHPS